jgi:hypothetical protein
MRACVLPVDSRIRREDILRTGEEFPMIRGLTLGMASLGAGLMYYLDTGN